MLVIARQLYALTILVARHWRRAGYAQIKGAASKRGSGMLFRILAVVMFGNIGYTAGIRCTDAKSEDPIAAVGWLLFGMFGWSGFWGFLSGAPIIRAAAAPLAASILEALPLSITSRVIIMVIQHFAVHTLTVAAIYGAVPQFGMLRALGVGLSLSFTAIVTGNALVRLYRVIAPPDRVLNTAALALGVQLPFYLIFFFAGRLGSVPRLAAVMHWLEPVGIEILSGHFAADYFAWLLGISVIAALGIALSERIGYDRLDVVPNKKLKPVRAEKLSLSRIEILLSSREPGGMAAWVLLVQNLLFSGGVLFLGYRARGLMEGEAGAIMIRTLTFLIPLVSFSAVYGRAQRLAARDDLARPMLAPLPILPSDLLKGKAGVILTRTLWMASPYFLVLGLPGTLAFHFEIAWRGVMMIAALWLASDAAVSIAFLVSGLGAPRTKAGSQFSLETTLVLAPLLSVVGAPYFWNAIVSLAVLAMLRFEARQAALRCVRWIDDSDDLERDTPVWRALLAFATFQATELLAARALSFTRLSLSYQTAATYLLGAAVLVILSPIRSISFLGKRRLTNLALGLLAGIASGAFALGYLHILRANHVTLPAPPADGRWALALSAIVVAPIAEEIFFRGWLQKSVDEQYRLRAKSFAPLVTAFAFAAIHPPLSFVPVLVLGILSGFLYASSGGVMAGILAHMAHNAIAFLGQ